MRLNRKWEAVKMSLKISLEMFFRVEQNDRKMEVLCGFKRKKVKENFWHDSTPKSEGVQLSRSSLIPSLESALKIVDRG